jgi:hypothetical protein
MRFFGADSYAARPIGSIRRECVAHVIVFGQWHLRYVLRSYHPYYNGAPNTSAAKDDGV